MEIRKARLSDVAGIAHLLAPFVETGEILPRSVETIFQSLRDWVVAEEEGRLVGCGSLVILWDDLAEIRSLVVAPGMQGRGVGRLMVEALLAEAETLDLPRVFALTRKEGFFRRLSFVPTERDALPRKVWKDCVYCRRFVNCDEVALIRELPVKAAAQELAASAYSPALAQVSAGE